MPQPHVPAKNASGNKFEALANEDLEAKIPKEEEEVATPLEQDPPAEAPSPKKIDLRSDPPYAILT